MNLLAQLTFDRPSKKIGSGHHAANLAKRDLCHSKIRSALQTPGTVRSTIKETGLSQGFIGRYIKELERDGCVKLVGKTIGAQCRKPSNLWIWIDK